MSNYKISNVAKEDLIRIYKFGVANFGTAKADVYFNQFFDYFKIISESPFSFESVSYIRENYRRCVCGSDSIYYKISPEGIVEIMTIIGKQDLQQNL